MPPPSIEGALAQLGEMYVDVEVFSADGTRSLPLRAKIDTGAYAALLDHSTIASLGLRAVEQVTLQTAAGQVPSHTYITRVTAAPIWDANLLIVGGKPGKDAMLLGRNWLRHFELVYDGPARRFSVRSASEAPR